MALDAQALVIFLIIGAVAGWLAGQIVEGDDQAANAAVLREVDGVELDVNPVAFEVTQPALDGQCLAGLMLAPGDRVGNARPIVGVDEMGHLVADQAVAGVAEQA